MIKSTLFLFMIAFCSYPFQTGTDYIDKLTAQYSGSGIVFVLPAIGLNGNCEIIIHRDPVSKYFQLNESKHYTSFQGFLKSLLFDKKKYDLRKAPKAPFTKIDGDVGIIKEYRARGIQYIIRTYLNNNKGRYMAKDMDEKNLHGLVWIMFKSEYFVYFSGYSGRYIFSKNVLK